MGTRHRVRCWYCGKRARRVQSTRGLAPFMLDSSGRVRVVLRKFTVLPFGVCGAKLFEFEAGNLCPQPMLRRKDALLVLRAAIEYEAGGHNVCSEYDL